MGLQTHSKSFRRHHLVKWKKNQDIAQTPRRTLIMRVVTVVHCIEVFESVFWTPFAMARHVLLPLAAVEYGGGKGVAVVGLG